MLILMLENHVQDLLIRDVSLNIFIYSPSDEGRISFNVRTRWETSRVFARGFDRVKDQLILRYQRRFAVQPHQKPVFFEGGEMTVMPEEWTVSTTWTAPARFLIYKPIVEAVSRLSCSLHQLE